MKQRLPDPTMINITLMQGAFLTNAVLQQCIADRSAMHWFLTEYVALMTYQCGFSIVLNRSVVHHLVQVMHRSACINAMHQCNADESSNILQQHWPVQNCIYATLCMFLAALCLKSFHNSILISQFTVISKLRLETRQKTFYCPFPACYSLSL
jgi:hypothetical protein